jgi:hypothetical protein
MSLTADATNVLQAVVYATMILQNVTHVQTDFMTLLKLELLLSTVWSVHLVVLLVLQPQSAQTVPLALLWSELLVFRNAAFPAQNVTAPIQQYALNALEVTPLLMVHVK